MAKLANAELAFQFLKSHSASNGGSCPKGQSNWVAYGLSGCRGALWTQQAVFRIGKEITKKMLNVYFDCLDDFFGVDKKTYLDIDEGMYYVDFPGLRSSASFGQMAAYPTLGAQFTAFYEILTDILETSDLKPRQALYLAFYVGSMKKVPGIGNNGRVSMMPLTKGNALITVFDKTNPAFKINESIQTWATPQMYAVTRAGNFLLHYDLDLFLTEKESYAAMYKKIIKYLLLAVKLDLYFIKRNVYTPIQTQDQKIMTMEEKLAQVKIDWIIPYLIKKGTNSFVIDCLAAERRINFRHRSAVVPTGYPKKKVFDFLEKELKTL